MRNKWFVAYKERGEDLFDTSGFTVVEPPDGTYQADPFPFSKDGKRYMFIEDYDYKLGSIAYAEIKEDGISDFKTIIKDDYHFSYPFVFEHKGETWMIPETARDNKIELFKCTEFPDKWDRVKTLVEIPGTDSTLIEANGLLWMFTQVGADSNVTVLVAEDLMGPWSLHSTNHFEHSRSAGKIFQYNNKILRPTQDCSKCYGHAIVFKEIQLTANGYEEETYCRIEPDWHEGLIGTHTFNFDDKYVFIDGKVQVED